MAPRKTTHRKGRPPEDAQNVLRRTYQGNWIPDDGRPGQAFSGEEPGLHGGLFPVFWTDYCECSEADRCIRRWASEFTMKRFSCANGGYLKIEEP